MNAKTEREMPVAGAFKVKPIWVIKNQDHEAEEDKESAVRTKKKRRNAKSGKRGEPA